MLGNLRVRLDDGELAVDEHLLAEVKFSTDWHDPAQPRLWPIGLNALESAPSSERWVVSEAVTDRQIDGFTVSQSADWSWVGREYEIETTDLAALSEQIFVRLHQLAAALDQPHVARLWVLIPDIHRGQGDAERYKQFCLGRHAAYEQLGIVAPHYPAATVIGAHQGPLRLHVLLCRQAGQTLENPQQTSAYRYPREYGPKSPSFSRALRLDRHLFVSGTAAIRGSQSQQPGDAVSQLHIIDDNLNALCGHSDSPWHLSAAYGRIYLRDAEQARAIRAESGRLWPGSKRWPVVHGDICRAELLCEVETGL